MMAPTVMKPIRLNPYRSRSDTKPRTPCCSSERPAPRKIVSGPATPKKRMVATKLMNVATIATGSGVP
jgi:hypothetical protein